jgi:V/A-type H+-transporting ATPase subunit I
MAIVDMKRISLIGFEKHQEQVLETLMRMGAVELENIQQRTSEEEWMELVIKDGEEETVSRLDSEIDRVGSALEYLSRYNSGKKSFFNSKRELNRADFTNIIRDSKKIWDAVDIISECDEKLSLLRSEENRLESLKANIEPWQALDIPLETTSTQTSDVLLGVIPAPAHDMKDIVDDLTQKVSECSIEIINTDRDMLYLCIIYHKSCSDKLTELLKVPLVSISEAYIFFSAVLLVPVYFE